MDYHVGSASFHDGAIHDVTVAEATEEDFWYR